MSPLTRTILRAARMSDQAGSPMADMALPLTTDMAMLVYVHAHVEWTTNVRMAAKLSHGDAEIRRLGHKYEQEAAMWMFIGKTIERLIDVEREDWTVHAFVDKAPEHPNYSIAELLTVADKLGIRNGR